METNQGDNIAAVQTDQGVRADRLMTHRQTVGFTGSPSELTRRRKSRKDAFTSLSPSRIRVRSADACPGLAGRGLYRRPAGIIVWRGGLGLELHPGGGRHFRRHRPKWSRDAALLPPEGASDIFRRNDCLFSEQISHMLIMGIKKC